MPGVARSLKALNLLAAAVLAAVVSLVFYRFGAENPGAAPLHTPVLEEITSEPVLVASFESEWESPGARFERLIQEVGRTFLDHRLATEFSATAGTIPNVQKHFSHGIAEAIVRTECFRTAHWNSARGFSDGMPYSVPHTYADGVDRSLRLARAALRVYGVDGVRFLGPLFFARQLDFAEGDVVCHSLGDLATIALQDTKVPGPELVAGDMRRSDQQYYAPYRVWWLEMARIRGWAEELRVVRRMMEERGIRPDGTGGHVSARQD